MVIVIVISRCAALHYKQRKISHKKKLQQEMIDQAKVRHANLTCHSLHKQHHETNTADNNKWESKVNMLLLRADEFLLKGLELGGFNILVLQGKSRPKN
jgi:hypothetical protein